MKRLIWGTAILFVVAATCAYADSIPTFSITQAKVFVGAGSDNVFFILTGPGISIAGFGGIQCQIDWCDGQVFPPGSVAPGGFGFDGQIFLENTDVKIGGHDLGDTLDLTPFLALNTSGGFTFPRNPKVGSRFTGCQPAAMPSSFTGSAGSGDEFINFILQMPAGGKFCSTWDFVPASDESAAGYLFSQGKFLAATPIIVQRYAQINLVSDIPGLAAFTDKKLKNPWGIAFGPTSPFWIADNGTGLSTLYAKDGMPIPQLPSVRIPPPRGSSATATPTGMVFNPTADFVVSGNGNSGPAVFMFATEDGTISGWNPTVALHRAVLALDNSQIGAVYKGLAFSHTSRGNFIYATNFHDGSVEMYDANFQLVKTFTDIGLPPGYAPFGIQTIRGKLYVTFAKQDADKHDDVPGSGHGFVDVFNFQGHLLQRLVSRNRLNSPWGVALAPATFGNFSGALLVGNFGDGKINAFDPGSGTFLGVLRDLQGHILSIDGLWTITFGNGASTGPRNALFFSAGPNHEADGLFGVLTVIP